MADLLQQLDPSKLVLAETVRNTPHSERLLNLLMNT